MVGGKSELNFGHGIPAMFAGSSPVQEKRVDVLNKNFGYFLHQQTDQI
jgi:hypothetical protein